MSKPAPAPHIAIIDDDGGVRHSMGMLLETRKWTYTEFERAGDFLQNATPGDFNCLLIDVRIPDMSGLELYEELLRRAKKRPRYIPPAIFLTGHGDIPMAVKALKQGACDFLEKPVNHRSLLDAISRAIDIDSNTRPIYQSQSELLNEIAELTQRERQVLTEIVAGYLSKQIAAHLDISTKTVEAHRLRICQKFKIRTSMELAAKLRAISPSWWENT
jgi:two-component system, LuxR family, response regulator DctR